MASDQEEKEKISRLIKEGRAARGLTQQELADLAGIALRSVQRIENGEVLVRTDTLQVISDKLGIAIPLRRSKKGSPKILFPAEREAIGSKIALSAVLGVCFILSGVAFIYQSDTFPESALETVVLWIAVLAGYGVSLYFIWKKKARARPK